MIRALLVAIKPLHPPEFVNEFALALAECHGLELSACSIIDLHRLAPAEPVPLGGGAFKAHRDEQAIAAARTGSADAMTRFSQAALARGISCQTQILEGDTASLLAAAVQPCDALVCGHTPGGDASERSLLHSILKHCPRPAIIVPQTASDNGSAVLVAYDGSAQAARALASFAGSGLAQGREIHVAAFAAQQSEAERQSHVARSFLARHGLACRVHASEQAHHVGSHILAEAARVGAGLVVMGAFGKSSVREFFFGSVTLSLLEKLPVPLFLDH